MTGKLGFALSFMLMTMSLGASAAADDDGLKINGFASLVGGKTFNSDGNTNRFQADVPNAGSYDDKLNFKPDSIMGLQFSKQLTKEISITTQLTAAGQTDFDAEIGWAYLKYEFSPTQYLLAGQQRLPLFFYSDYIDVGYAYHWIRPPTEATGAIMNNFTGVLFSQSTRLGNWDTTASVYAGAADEDLAQFGPTSADDIYGLVLASSNDWLQLRATYSVQDIGLNSDDPMQQSYSYGVLQDDENPIDLSFWGVASHATIGDGFLAFEYTSTDFGSRPLGLDIAIGTTKSIGWYLTGGWTFGDFTPHITYHVLESPTSKDLGPVLQGFFSLPSDPFNGEDQNAGSTAVTVGLRWDIAPGTAFKMEYTDRDEDYDPAYLGVFGDGKTVSVFSLGLDMVF